MELWLCELQCCARRCYPSQHAVICGCVSQRTGLGYPERITGHPATDARKLCAAPKRNAGDAA